jgi:ABC-type uncharacterized transport system permease subunit
MQLAVGGLIGAVLAVLFLEVFFEHAKFLELKLAIGVGGILGALVGHGVCKLTEKRDPE